jgi:hypothetical protein
MTGKRIVAGVTEYRIPSLDRVQRGVPGIGITPGSTSGGRG